MNFRENGAAFRCLRALAAAASGAAFCAAAMAQAADAAPSARVIVKFKRDAAISRAHPLSATASASETTAGTAARADALAARHGLRLKAGRALDRRTQVLLSSELDAATLQQRLAQDADVEYVVIDRRRRRHALPNDPLYQQGPPVVGSVGGPAVGQWYLHAPAGEAVSGINAPGAWDRTTGSAGIVVAVLDTGVRPEHPDLAGRLVAGYDMISDVTGANDADGRDGDASDPGDWVSYTEAHTLGGPFYGCDVDNSSWHGTKVSSLIGAATGNGAGMAGLAWNVKLLPVRVLGKCGGYDSDIIAGMRWAAGLAVPGVPTNANPARVMNMSLGDVGTCPQTYLDALAEIGSLPNAPVIVASAGNDSGFAVSAPGNCPGVIAVAGLRHAGTKVGYSDVGPEVAISAPAGNCVNIGISQPCLYPIVTATNTGATSPLASTYSDSFNASFGTSFSAPLVAGTAALMLSVQPSWTPSQVKAALQSTARPFPASGAPDDPTTGPIQTCHAPNGSEQLQCYCTTATCGAGMLDAAAAVAAAFASTPAGSIALSAGWNLVGNGTEASIAVANAFGDASKVISVWKWVPQGMTPGVVYPAWAFYSPALAAGGQAYAAGKGYDALTSVNAGEGFWVNAKQAFNVPLPAGTPVHSDSFMPPGGTHALPAGWSLIATGDSPTPQQFDVRLNAPDAPAGSGAPTNFITLWAWDAAQSSWYFWSPALANNGGLAGYLVNKGYLDFPTLPATPVGTLPPTRGFWVNR